MMELKINPEFRDLIPPLTQDEYRGLEESLISDGCRDAIIVWNETIIDGHNRYDICTKNEIPFVTAPEDFADESEAKIWIIKNQFARRNISNTARALLALRLEPMIAARAKANQGQRNDIPTILTECSTPIDTREEVAHLAGVSQGTLYKVKTVRDKGDPDTLAKMISTEISIDAGYRQTIAPRPHVVNNSGNNEWYTPSEYIESARRVLGEIDLDPASNENANRTVKAAYYFTIEDDGLAQEWHGRVWLNPPYSSDLVSRFADKTVAEYNAMRISGAIVLINNATETGWFNTFIGIAAAVVFPKSRIKYNSPDGVKGAPLQGQAFIYIGVDRDAFLTEFSKYGWGAAVNG